MTKGIDYERKLVRKLWDNNYASVRIPASGGGKSTLQKPDIITSNGRNCFIIEAKTTSADHVYIYERQMDGLLKFASMFGGTPWIAVRFKKRVKYWLFFKPESLRRTKSGLYIVHFVKDLAMGIKYESLVNR